MDRNQKTKRGVGRPPMIVNFPKRGRFTIKQVAASRTRNTITKVALLNKLKKLVADKKIKIVGTRIVGRGRPAFIFERV